MPAYFETSDIVKDKYIFVSYSHEDSVFFNEMTEFLIKLGVRLWTDRAFCPADRWEEEVKGLLRHQNCRGVIWLCSENSIKSKAVHMELATALTEQKKHTEENYPIFIVNVCSDCKPNSYMKLLKKSFDLLEADTIDDTFEVAMLQNLVTLISGGTICVKTCNENYQQVMFDTIKSKHLGVIDKSFITLEEMQAVSRNSDVFINFGTQNKNGTNEPLKWRFLRYEGDDAIFLSEEIISEDYGGEYLEQWLNTGFKNGVFTAVEISKIIKPLRLLSNSEVEQLALVDNDQKIEWWLSDARGRLQSIVRDDGTIYVSGYNNKQFKKGVRPVIVLHMEQALEIISEQNKR